MSDFEQPSVYGEWPVESGAFVVRYPIALLHEIDFNVKDAARRISHGGMETGGFLFGRTGMVDQREAVQIEAFRAIDCEHASGPSFVLSEQDMTKMREQLLQSGSDPGLEGLRLLGWFIGHARNPLRLSDHEASLFDRLFPRPGQLTLLVKPERFAPSNLAFIVRGPDRKVDRDGTKLAFPIPRMSGPAPKPVEEPPDVVAAPANLNISPSEPRELRRPIVEPAPEPAVMAVEPAPPPPPVAMSARAVEPPAIDPLAFEPTVPEPVTFKAPTTDHDEFRSLMEPDAAEPVTRPISVKPFPAKPASFRSILDETLEMNPPGKQPEIKDGPVASPRPAFGRVRKEIAPTGDFLSLDDLRARRLQRPERSEPFEQFEPANELARRPATFAFMQRHHTEMWRPAMALLIALIIMGVGFHYYVQYFVPAVPLQVDDRVDKLMVSWPPDATRDAGESALRVDGGPPFQLSMEEKVLGRAEITAPGNDVKVELVIHHWYGSVRGRVRFVKPAITSLP